MFEVVVKNKAQFFGSSTSSCRAIVCLFVHLCVHVTVSMNLGLVERLLGLCPYCLHGGVEVWKVLCASRCMSWSMASTGWPILLYSGGGGDLLLDTVLFFSGGGDRDSLLLTQ